MNRWDMQHTRAMTYVVHDGMSCGRLFLVLLFTDACFVSSLCTVGF